MRWIDVAKAKQIEDLITEKVNNQSPSPETEPALRRLIEGIRTGKPNYEEITPPLADLTRKQLSHLHADISEAGSIQSIRFVGVGSGGADVYRVQHERRTLRKAAIRLAMMWECLLLKWLSNQGPGSKLG